MKDLTPSTFIMKYHEMTKNYIFREFECGLMVEETAELCLKSVRAIKEWDEGKVNPKECKRLMRFSRGVNCLLMNVGVSSEC